MPPYTIRPEFVLNPNIDWVVEEVTDFDDEMLAVPCPEPEPDEDWLMDLLMPKKMWAVEEDKPRKEKKPCPHDGLYILRSQHKSELMIYLEALDNYGREYGLRIDTIGYDRWGEPVNDRFVLIDDTQGKNEHRRFWKELDKAYNKRRCDEF